MEKVEYCIYNPGGNETALVFDNTYNSQEKRFINNKILSKHSNIEQVGFINKEKYELQMAGGEFCGNATRCATKYYLSGNYDKEMFIKVSGMKERIRAGVDIKGNTWTEIPIKSTCVIKNDINIVKLDGITHIVVNEERSKKYLKKFYELKKIAKKIIGALKIEDLVVGVMFTEIKNNIVKLYPIVWVKSIDTIFYETACGSGTAAVAACNINNETVVLQPSGYEIIGTKTYNNYIKITGITFTDNIVRSIKIYEEGIG